MVLYILRGSYILLFSSLQHATLPANDKKWPEVVGEAFKLEYGRQLSAEDQEKLSQREINELLRKHPNVAAQLNKVQP